MKDANVVRAHLPFAAYESAMRVGWLAVREMGLVIAILLAVFALHYPCVIRASLGLQGDGKTVAPRAPI